jgi:nucleoside-diphosphate-sugar epimerase
MTRTLLLGANGFLGRQVRHTVLWRDRAPHMVAVSGHRWLPSESPNCDWQRIDLVRASVEDVALLLDYSKPDVVINCAGRTVGSVDELEAVNVSVVRKLLEALARIDPIPLVHLGTAAEYGCQPRGLAIPEWATARPATDYGRTKLAATELIADAVARGDVSATVLRVFDPIGPGMPGHTLVGTALREIRLALAARASFVTLGQLSSCRDFLAAADVADAVLRAACTPEVPVVLNVGRGVSMSGRSVVELLAAAAGFDGDIFESSGGSHPPPPAVWQQADLTLLRRHLHWVPTTSIAEAVRDLWQSGS